MVQENTPAATMKPVLIAKGPTPVTATLGFNGIQIRCDVKVTLELCGLRERNDCHSDVSKQKFVAGLEIMSSGRHYLILTF